MIKTIGILGGMGPGASASFYQQLVDTAQSQYNAVQDEEYPEMILYSLALKDFGENAKVEQEHIKKQLINGVQKLEKAGADFVVIPCNTVHYHYESMQNSISIPIISIIKETAKFIAENDHKKIGLICSESTNELGLYSKCFEEINIECLSPTKVQQNTLNQVILSVMGGTNSYKEHLDIEAILDDYAKKADAMVLGCTELPLALDKTKTKHLVFDTIEILTNAALKYSYDA